MDSLGHFEGKEWLGIADFTRDMQRMDDVVKSQVSSFEQAKSRAEEMTQALSGTAVTSRDLSDAQHALRQATDANVQGLIRMDQATLDNLKDAIDQTKKKMKDLADEARETAEQLEGELAKLRGEDDKSLAIEQAKDLRKIEELLRDARKRGNAEEIKYYNEALNLQKEINKEERKKLSRDEQEKRERERESSERNSSRSSNSSSNSSSSNSNRSPSTGDSTTAKDVVDALDVRISRERDEAAKLAVEKLMQQLKDEAKRRT